MPDEAGGFDVDEFLSEVRPTRASATICHRQDLVDEHERLAAELAALQQTDLVENRHPQAPVVAERILELEAKMDAAQRTFVFESIGRLAWADLLAAHPPSEEDAKAGVDYNPATFPSAAIVASCVIPKITIYQAETMERKLSVGQWRKLWQACLAANWGDDQSPKSLAATLLHHLSEGSSTTAPHEGSLAASS